MIRYFSTFSGIGGFELGIAGLGECVGYSEVDKYATQIYQKRFTTHKNYGDITAIDPAKIPDFDLIVGGFPCQSFSIAGRREGFADTRGTLFFDVARIISEKRPRLVFLENVKGLLSHDGGKTFATILRSLADLGYDIQWQVLNSKNFGVPQNRERVFIIGHLRNTSRPQIFPLRPGSELFDEKPTGKAQATHPLRAGYKAGQGGNDFIIHNIYGGFKEKKVREFYDYSPTIRTPQGGGHLPMVVTASPKYGKGKREVNHKLSDTVPTIRANHHKGGDNNPMIIDDFYPDRIREFEGSPTLRSGRAGLKISKGSMIRKLTPIECERLQGFPDNWTEGISDTQRYKTLGNAVTVNVIRELAKRLLDVKEE